jgi:hypothetical protein
LVWKHLKADTIGRSAIQSYADFQRESEIIDAFLAAPRREYPLLLPKDTLKYAAGLSNYLCTA